MLDGVEIGSADPAGQGLDQDFARLGRGICHLVDDELAAAKYDGTHGLVLSTRRPEYQAESVDCRPLASSLLAALLAALLVACPSMLASQEPPPTDPDAGWQTIGSFAGTIGTGAGQRLSDWFFEELNDGSLYEDLGDLSLGVGLDIRNVELDWDNAVKRRVIPAHRELAAGETITAADLSSYQQVTSQTTRGRITYDYLPEVVGTASIGAQVEAGFSLALSATRDSLVFSDSSLETILEESAAGLERFPRARKLSLDRDLPANLSIAARRLVDPIARALARGTADTERGALFYAGYADPLTLFVDLGAPLDAALFSEQDTRLLPGDRATHTTFVGFSPIVAGVRETALEARYRRFYRYLRQTTVQKEPENQVLVEVRSTLHRGNELLPFKLRPKLRLFGWISLGYTLSELRSERSDELVADVGYRIDLDSAGGRAVFDRLLGNSTEVSLRPRLEIDDTEGVEVLGTELRRGEQLSRTRMARFPSWFRSRTDVRNSVHRIETESIELDEAVRGRWKDYRRYLGGERQRRRWRVVTLQSRARPLGDGPDREPRSGWDSLPSVIAIEDGLRTRHADPAETRQLAFLLSSALAAGPSPALEALDRFAAGQGGRYSSELRMSLGPEQLSRLAAIDDEQLWAELAEQLLGPQHRNAWSKEQRRLWMPAPRRSSTERHISEAYDELLRGIQTPAKQLGLVAEGASARSLFVEAARTVKLFRRSQEFIATGDCLQCLLGPQTRLREGTLLLLLMARFAGGAPGGVGYHLELFTDEMSRPLVAGNGVSHLLHRHEGQTAIAAVDTTRLDWWIPRSTARSAPARLNAGNLMIFERGGPSLPGPCWKVRLITDLRFAPALQLRAELRSARTGADLSQVVWSLELGAARDLEPSPFQPRRFAHDVALPWWAGLEGDETYTLLLRALNSEGRPVTEEQQIRFRLPADWPEQARDRCAPDLPPPGLASDPVGAR